MKLVFNEDGKLIAFGSGDAETYANDPSKVIGDAVDGVNEMWRYSYDHASGAVVVAYADMTDEDAMAQLAADAAAEANG